MTNPFKALIEAFRNPSPFAMASAELEAAQRQLLISQSGLEYAKAMVSYHEDRIKRLTATVKKMAESAKKEDAQ